MINSSSKPHSHFHFFSSISSFHQISPFATLLFWNVILLFMGSQIGTFSILFLVAFSLFFGRNQHILLLKFFHFYWTWWVLSMFDNQINCCWKMKSLLLFVCVYILVVIVLWDLLFTFFWKKNKKGDLYINRLSDLLFTFSN